jgi:2-polyprenyl-3-methyl-5-hydroxy-6-metoxy-1,4-benzoquinol methylase
MKIDLTTKPEEYFTGDRSEMLKYIPDHAKRILEVGCGEGNFGAYLKKKLNAEVWGVEYEDAHAEVAKKNLDKVYSGDIAVLVNQLPDSYFDVIVCNDVLEHLTDPYTVLDKMKNKLTKGGIVVSSIPNIRFFRTFFDFILNKNWDYTDNGIMDKTHYRFFTIKSIKKMYENVGYEVLQLEGINATKSIRPFLWNTLFLGALSDIKYRQFATVARPIG